MLEMAHNLRQYILNSLRQKLNMGCEEHKTAFSQTEQVMRELQKLEVQIADLTKQYHQQCLKLRTEIEHLQREACAHIWCKFYADPMGGLDCSFQCNICELPVDEYTYNKAIIRE